MATPMSDLALQPRRSGTLYALLAVIVLFLAINARWIWIYRHGLVLDIDEAGYLSLSIIDYYGLLYNGITGWISAIEAPSIQAPLTTALTSLVYFVTGLHVIAGFVVPVLAGAGCVAAAYALGRSIGTPRTGLVAAVLTASCPVIVNFSRSYHFSMPATLVTTLALVAIIRSRGFRSIGYALAFGVCLGLMPLARTMTIAFFPGMVAAAFLVVVVDPKDLVRRLLILTGSGVVAILVAASWLWFNGLLVAHYLFSFGYGVQALEYGHKASKLGPDAWWAMISSFVNEVYFPHLFVMLLGLLALVVLTAQRAVQRGIVPAFWLVLRSPILPCLVFAAEAILMLTSSSNKGSGFFAPVSPALLTIAAWAFGTFSYGWLRKTLGVFVTVVALMATIPMLDLHTPFAPVWLVNMPILGGGIMTQGRGNIQSDLAIIGYGKPDDVEPFDPDTNRAWVNLSNWTAATIGQEVGQDAVVAYGFRNAFYNVNTVNLQHLIDAKQAYGGRQIEPSLTGESVEGYLGWLKAEGTDACALLTSDRPGGDFRPIINRAFMQEAARQAGFEPGRSWPTPDGQTITLWKHKIKPANCHY
jgi:4-amino-4-deoxy-L-arabinose transferase-like glycosyltransferase